ncbi:E3 ubiquitin-protein ligase MARCH6 [Pelomyxa schiedti]|nr:E3 ubiquitin-protein ligase MARCH6 [Pelomyxa schiedti]
MADDDEISDEAHGTGTDVHTAGDTTAHAETPVVGEGSVVPSTSASTSDRDQDQDGDGENVCRVCRGEGTPDDPLRHPCKCSGSIKWVHEGCLMQWLQRTGQPTCEVCGHSFRFHFVYAPGTPAVLPMTVLVYGLITRVIQSLKKAWKLFLVSFCWGFILPVYTSWVFLLYFGDSTETASATMSSNETSNNTSSTVSTMLSGSVRSLGLRVVGRPIAMTVAALAARMALGYCLVCAVIVCSLCAFSLMDYIKTHIQHSPKAQATYRRLFQPQPQPQSHQLQDRPQEAYPQAPVGEQNTELHDQLNYDGLMAEQLPNGELGGNLLDTEEVHDLGGNLPPGIPPADNTEAEEAVANVQEQDFVEAELENDIPIPPNHEGPADNGHANAVEAQPALDFEELDLNALLGIRGSILALFGKCIALGVYNTVFIFTFAMMPHKLGSLFWFVIGSLRGSTYSLPQVFAVPLGLSSLMIVDIMGFRALLFFIKKNVPLSPGGKMESATKTIALLYIFCKVCLLMTYQLGLFPLMLGFSLQLSAMGITGLSTSSLIWFIGNFPSSALFCHWVIGFGISISLASVISWTRLKLRKERLWFFHDPSEPDFHPIKIMIETPCRYLLRKALLSSLFYMCFVSACTYLPSKILELLPFPSTFPLVFKFNSPLAEGPLQLVTLHFLIPICLEYLKPSLLAKDFTLWWLLHVCYALGPQFYNWMIKPPETATFLRIQHAVDQQVAQHETRTSTVPYDQPDRPSHLRAQLSCFLLSIFLSVMVLEFLIIFISLFVGRLMVSLLNVSVSNDLYCIVLGALSCLGVVQFSKFVYRFVAQHPVPTIVSLAVHWLLVSLRLFLCGSIILSVFPLASGILSERLLIIPLSVSLDQCAQHFYGQAWALGVVTLKLWYFVEVTINPNVQRQFNTMWQRGIPNIQMKELAVLLTPCLIHLMIPLAVPELFIFGMKYILPPVEDSFASMIIERYSHTTFVVAMVASVWCRRIVKRLWALHQSIRDDTYLVGRHLVDNTPDVAPEQH